MNRFQSVLNYLGACQPALDWVGTTSFRVAWVSCERPGWLLWLAGKARVERRYMVLAACAVAEEALQYVPIGEDRPRQAIRAAQAWVAAAYVASCTARAASAIYAADATYAAADAADAAYVASCTAYAAVAASAVYAALAAPAADARQEAQRRQCDLIRRTIPARAVWEGLILVETRMKRGEA